MIRVRLRWAAALAVAACLAGSAATPATARLSAADRAVVARVEAYLNTIRSVRSNFVQISSAGQVAEGRIYLQRPNRVRLDYKPPSALQIYASGYWLVYVDTELEEVTHIPLKATLAGLLVSKKVRLSGDVTVTRVERAGATLRLHMVQSKEPEAGQLILALADEPLRLSHWTVVDPEGGRTRISFVGPEFNVRIAKKVFEFDESRFDRPDY